VLYSPDLTVLHLAVPSSTADLMPWSAQFRMVRRYAEGE
jgi:hypothetical protein